MRRTAIIAGILGLGVLAASWTTGGSQTPGAEVKIAPPSAKLVFNEKGDAALPRGYRSWVHVYTAWEPITESFLDEKQSLTPEVHNVYIDPNAYRNYMLTGKWPEGTLIVKEFSSTRTDQPKCDGPPAYICDEWFGKVIPQHGYTGVAVMLKDSKRYPKEAGGWAFFSYGHQAPPYKAFSPAHETARCAQCHIDRAGPAQDYVFSESQPGFSRKGDDAANNLAAAFLE